MEDLEEGNKAILIVSAAVFWFIANCVTYMLFLHWEACEFTTITGVVVDNPFFHTYTVCAIVMVLFITLLICDSIFVYVANGFLRITDISVYVISIGILSYWVYVYVNYWQIFQPEWSADDLVSLLYKDAWTWFSVDSGDCHQALTRQGI